MSKPLVVAISGASGVIYGVEMLRALQTTDCPAHLILSSSAGRNLQIEMDLTVSEVKDMAEVVYANKDLAASVSSGSFQTRGMVVAPCSIKSLSGIANSYNDNLITRAADVSLKERRTLVLMVRETPLHKGHLDLMSRAADLGAIILPPVPAFYHRPETIQDIINQSIGKALDQFGIEHNLFRRWSGDQAK
ncbi:MAG: UbiX family flavin prenyltransferase [Alphaproteobacteria bacterium]|nr:UbiX family flavin prenyltransferase [Alphaproteobacteria bacterium]MBT4019472.1 UbiX family flavin prenyltransferase [Alphaproteobacteria bacterium]MBT4967294.1 UbiX family flavin prenyltransferase [Alphaproteobacteria bacterium]MBT5160463.1 UbiX family flavin prenyltransferase [Alphaproteobacteria bacterium]MBT5917807.1 UbiX family flavin prenyltransferase [Alphaproteobacteria bacterium]